MKIDTYEIKGVTPEVQDFVDDATTILNNGKFSYQVSSTVPTWNANNGEMVLYSSGTEKRFYYRLNDKWNTVYLGSQEIKARVVWSGTGTLTILDSLNVSSMTDQGEGQYTVVFATSFASIRYAVSGMVRELLISGTQALVGLFVINTPGNPAPESLKVRVAGRHIGGGDPLGASQAIVPEYASLIAVGN